MLRSTKGVYSVPAAPCCGPSVAVSSLVWHAEPVPGSAVVVVLVMLAELVVVRLVMLLVLVALVLVVVAGGLAAVVVLVAAGSTRGLLAEHATSAPAPIDTASATTMGRP